MNQRLIPHRKTLVGIGLFAAGSASARADAGGILAALSFWGGYTFALLVICMWLDSWPEPTSKRMAVFAFAFFSFFLSVIIGGWINPDAFDLEGHWWALEDALVGFSGPVITTTLAYVYFRRRRLSKIPGKTEDQSSITTPPLP